MKFDSFSMYSELTKNEVRTSTDVEDVNDLVKELDNFYEEKEVKEWLVTNWGIKHNISNYPISKNARMSTKDGKTCFNVTIKEDNNVQSYNYRKGV